MQFKVFQRPDGTEILVLSTDPDLDGAVFKDTITATEFSLPNAPPNRLCVCSVPGFSESNTHLIVEIRDGNLIFMNFTSLPIYTNRLLVREQGKKTLRLLQ